MNNNNKSQLNHKTPYLSVLVILASLSSLTEAETPVNNPILEHVTVTATRSETTQQPLSISKIADIQALQATHINEVVGQSPGSWISRGNGQEHLTAIRSPVLTGGGSCNAFYMAEDNIPLRAPAFCNVNQLFDVNFEQAQSIEVIRGPGTAFQGNSALHGVINVISPAFSLQPQTDVGAMIGSHDIGRLSVDHRQQQWMLQTHIDKDNGYKDDAGYEQQKLRFKALQQGPQWNLTHSINLANLDQQTAGYIQGKDAYKDDDLKKANNNNGAYRQAKSLRLSSDFRFYPKAKSEFIFTPYARLNEMEFLMHYLPGTPVEENGHHSLGWQSAFIRQYRENIRLSSGFDFDYSRGFLQQTQTEPDLFGGKIPQGQQYDYDVEVRDMGMFLQVDAQLHPQWDLSLGLRLQHARYKYENKLTDGTACETSVAIEECRYYRPSDDKQNYFNWSPHASISYAFSADNYSYLSLARAFRSPHTSDLYRLEGGQAEADINSEQLDSAEIGFNGLIAQQLRYGISLFMMKKDNVIIKTSQRERIDGQKTQHQGIELSINYAIVDELIFAAAMSYAKHRYDSNVALFGSASSAIKGNIIDTAPRHMHNYSLTWLATDKARWQIEAIYMGDYYLDAANDFSYEGHTLTNLRYEQQLPKGWRLDLALINATDEDYAERADINAFATPAEERYFIGEPRNLRLGINKRF